LQLSIIIVNYNVKYFLEQCLYSVQKAIHSLDAEVWVVDNASSDNSIDYLQPKFNCVNFIASKQNVGFAKANNEALYKCNGKYVLFLNPDTLLPEDCLHKAIAFMEANEKAGALGIRMIDGSGKFLPESKRAFPGPLTSFFKLMGFNSLFPKSRIFSRYSLGYLNEFKNHEVDVLAGAFMLVRRDVLLQLKGFDDTFFMYGEDIDLSFRIQKAGYKNYYFSESCIIHFKGESTRKGSLNYVRMFYQAMSIFVKKHYSGGKAWIFTFLIQVAIIIRGAFSALLKFLLRIGLPLVDAIIIFSSLQLVKFLWIHFVRGGYGFISRIVNFSLPGFTLVFLIAASLAGIYDNQYKPAKALYSAIVAIVVMLAVYSLLPERYRFSRAVILLGGFAALTFITLFRWILSKWRLVDDEDETKKQRQTLVVGTREEYLQVFDLMKKSGISERVIGRVAANGLKRDAVATFEELTALSESIPVKEIIFCQGYLTYSAIINKVQQLPKNVSLRFHADCSESIVGSDSKDTAGEFVAPEANFNIAQPYERRMKRLLDIAVAVFVLLTFPIQLLMFGTKPVYNAILVLIGSKTWVGYTQLHAGLPLLKPGVFNTTGHPSTLYASVEGRSIYNIDYWYAKNYHWLHDLKLLVKNYKRLRSTVN
jgi:O-antigen biosynthesis protein